MLILLPREKHALANAEQALIAERLQNIASQSCSWAG
jgi:hypothetical protein